MSAKIILGRHYEVMSGFKERHGFEHGQTIKCIHIDSNGRGGIFEGVVTVGDYDGMGGKKRFDTQHMNDFEIELIDETLVSIWKQEGTNE